MLNNGKITSRAGREGQAALQEVERAIGHPIPQAGFPAIITGRAKPQHTTRAYANSPLVPDLDCTDPGTNTDPSDFMQDCLEGPEPDADGYYADEFLPCGVWPVRYRWRAQWLPLTSEGCGYRQGHVDDPVAWVLWRQVMFALNTAHWSQDHLIDYPFIRAGTLVIMHLNRLSLMTETPKYGFVFHQMTDPASGVVPCLEIPPTTTCEFCCFFGPGNPANYCAVATQPNEAACFAAGGSPDYYLEECSPGQGPCDDETC